MDYFKFSNHIRVNLFLRVDYNIAVIIEIETKHWEYEYIRVTNDRSIKTFKIFTTVGHTFAYPVKQNSDWHLFTFQLLENI